MAYGLWAVTLGKMVSSESCTHQWPKVTVRVQDHVGCTSFWNIFLMCKQMDSVNEYQEEVDYIFFFHAAILSDTEKKFNFLLTLFLDFYFGWSYRGCKILNHYVACMRGMTPMVVIMVT